MLFTTLVVSDSPLVSAEQDAFDPSFYDSRAPGDDDDLQYIPREGESDHTSHKESLALARGDKEEAIMILEQEIDSLRKGRMSEVMDRFHTATNARDSYKRNLQWFPNANEKKRLANLDEEAHMQEKALAIVLDEERALTTRLKPLHGVVSWYFAADQQRAIKSSVLTVSEMGYNNAWYNTLFSIGEAESIQDLIMMFVGQYLLAFMIFYPFAILYFAFWTTPWNIYEYSSSLIDLPFGIIAWLGSVAVIALPFAGLVFGGYVLVRVMAAREAQRVQTNANRRGVGDRPPQQGEGASGQSYTTQANR